MYTNFRAEGSPSVTLHPSFDSKEYAVTPHPKEFARLAQFVGVPEQEISNIRILIEAKPIEAYGKLAFGRETADRIWLYLSGKNRRAQRKFLRHTAHELDHRAVRLTGNMDQDKIRRGRIRTIINPLNFLAMRYWFNPGEIHARETEREVLKSRQRYNLLTITDKPKR